MQRVLLAAAIAVAWLSANTSAVGKDKVLYLGGTVPDFPVRSAVRITVGAEKIEGTVSTKSDTHFVFDAGRAGSVEIRYSAILGLHYGPDAARPTPPGLVLFAPWDPTEQFTKDVHYVLTIFFRGQSGAEQAVAVELGSDLVRSTLSTLEHRSGKTVAFQNVDACARYKTRDDCGLGDVGELAGLTTLALDAAIRQEDRDLILAALTTAQVGLKVLDSTEGAEIILKFNGVRSPNPQCPCEGGRGEVVVMKGARERVVLVFADRKMGIWGKKPAADFGTAFVAAVKKANGPRHK